MGRVLLCIPPDVFEEVWSHLLPGSAEREAAGFIFVAPVPQDDDTQVFEYVEWYPVPPHGFVGRSPYHLELTDEIRAEVIKRAHDLEASIVEFHSHLGPYPAGFSKSDQLGFREFVPHVWWRLRKRPYFAVVFTQTELDGLAWLTDPRKPQHLDGIVVGRRVVKATKRSSLAIRRGTL